MSTVDRVMHDLVGQTVDERIAQVRQAAEADQTPPELNAEQVVAEAIEIAEDLLRPPPATRT